MTDNRTEEDRLLGRETIDDYNSPQYDNFLNNIFLLGSISHKRYDIFEDFNVTLGVLSPMENMEVARLVDAATGLMEKEQLVKIETLSRAIVKINGQQLRFSDTMIAEWREFRNVKDTSYRPSDVEQQRFMLQYRFNNKLINLVYQKYTELLEEQERVFLDLKKK